MTIALLLSPLSILTLAEGENAPVVYVTIIKQFEEAKDYGRFATERLAVTLTDADSDGVLTVNDALLLAHDAAYDGGASAGYAYSQVEDALKIDKLWGTSDAAYGCFLNHREAALSVPMQDGDSLTAAVLTEGKQDVYTYFSCDTASAVAEQPLTLTLQYLTISNDQVVSLPLADAVIFVNDVATEFKTDAEGKVDIILLREGLFSISAQNYDQAIVPPICTVTASPAQPTVTPNDTADSEQNGSDNGTELPELKFDTDDESGKGCKKGCGGVVGAPAAVIAVVGATLLMMRRREE